MGSAEGREQGHSVHSLAMDGQQCKQRGCPPGRSGVRAYLDANGVIQGQRRVS